jgi:flagellar motor switch protein FliM
MPGAAKQSQERPRRLGSAGTVDPQIRKLRGIHEAFARGLETTLSALLQQELHVQLGAIGLVGSGEFQRQLQSPDCIIVLRLHPRPERMILHIGCSTALALLELLLGGSDDSPPAPRELTEIEWSLLEEVVRAILLPLAEGWQGIAKIEFEVESRGSEPTLMQFPASAGPMVRIPVELAWADRTGTVVAAVPQEFFEGAEGRNELPQASPQEADRNLGLLEDAAVDLEVVLRGPTLPFEQLVALTPGQVVTFDYPVNQPLEASLNGEVWMAGHVVSAGRKRAFQVARLP